jgi:hypothetical protein
MGAIGTEEVLRAEAKAIHGVDFAEKSGTELYQALNGLDAAALCLSGGGIRSAAFGLGVIQALASYPPSVVPDKASHPTPRMDDCERSLLAKFHYLSTVSGGGYIGPCGRLTCTPQSESAGEVAPGWRAPRGLGGGLPPYRMAKPPFDS